MASVYALNLFDLASNEDYLAYSRRSAAAVAAHNGTVVAIGRFDGALESSGVEPRQAMILVEWATREDFEAFRADPSLSDLHPLRESGTENYVWWLFERLEDLRPLLKR